jgi:NAD(P)-dependent dehydrogenase (short-subunit alcohol dehydrogenase family)
MYTTSQPSSAHELEPFAPGSRLVSVLTGATGGIGNVVAHRLIEADHHVVVLVRNAERGESLCEELGESARWVSCDLASLESVRDAAQRLQLCLPHIDRLINNAGVYLSSKHRTVDGFETHFGVNYLAPFLLTHLLLPALGRAPLARIVNVSGETARFARINLKDLNRERRFTTLGAYGQSKLAQILFSRTVAERLQGTNVTVNALHPGPASTGHLSSASRGLRGFWSLMPGPERAGGNVSRLALDPAFDEVSGRYYFGGLRGFAPFSAYRRGLRERLYAQTAALVAVEELPERSS